MDLLFPKYSGWTSGSGDAGTGGSGGAGSGGSGGRLLAVPYEGRDSPWLPPEDGVGGDTRDRTVGVS